MFEELDVQQTPLGELILRRRQPVSMPGQWVYEVKLDGRFLMSSLVADSERELARRGLLRAQGQGLSVLVGGLGLGQTALAVLDEPRVARLDVIELLPAVVAWHQGGLVPAGPILAADPRCRIVQDDCFALLQRTPDRAYDAILIDIDDAPDDLLDEGHAGFYGERGLRAAKAWLRPGGVLALWTNVAHKQAFARRLGAAFSHVEQEDVVFDNPLLDEPETNALYFAR
jgi:spermidine synthase